MSGPVDVLAYLRREVEKGKYARPHIVAKRKAVLDAAAELIEAAQAEHTRAGRPVFGDGAASYDRLSAALARVQGGAA